MSTIRACSPYHVVPLDLPIATRDEKQTLEIGITNVCLLVESVNARLDVYHELSYRKLRVNDIRCDVVY